MVQGSRGCWISRHKTLTLFSVINQEMLYNIFVELNDKRYGQVLNRFLFFHWVDCPQSRVKCDGQILS